MRIACVTIPDLPVWAQRLQDPTLARAMVVIGGVPPERGVVTALSSEARARGLHVGMTLAAAQAIAPDARFARPDGETEARARRELLAELGTLSPRVEAGGGESFFLDLRGLGRLHASEEAFARRLEKRIEALGYPARVGVAGTKFAATVAAREARSAPRVLGRGAERAFLAPLSLDHLPAAGEWVEALTRLGLRTLGEWAALPSEAVAARFGSEGLRLQSLARGHDDDPLRAALDAEPLAVAHELDEPEEDLERLGGHIEQVVAALVRRLGARGLATSAVRLTLTLDDRSRVAREARFVRPALAPRLLLDCLRLALGREPPGGPVTALTLDAIETTPARAEQLLLFARCQAQVRDAVEAALARVRALVGPDGVVSPRRADSHRPETQISWEPYEGLPRADDPPPSTRLSRVHPQAETPPGPVAAGLPARLLAVPVAAEVRTAAGRPAQVVTAAVRGHVVTSDGPHALDGEWWASAYAREYWDVTLGDGGRYWIFRDRIAAGWFLHGVFD